MAYETKPNTGSLFKNNKPKNEKSAPYTGSVKIECPHCQQASEHWQSAWVNEKNDGSKYFGQKFNPKTAPAEQPKGEAKAYDLEDDNIPF